MSQSCTRRTLHLSGATVDDQAAGRQAVQPPQRPWAARLVGVPSGVYSWLPQARAGGGRYGEGRPSAVSANKRARNAGRQADPRAGERLLKQAMKNPGVRDLVEAYESWHRLERTAQAYRQVLAPKSVVSSSDTSAPNL